MGPHETPPLDPLRWLAPRVAAALLGLAAAVGAAETLFRVQTPRLVRIAAEERAYTETMTEGRARRILTQDDELGFRPVLGGDVYGEHGARWNDYELAKPEGTRRVLFLGDSVTYRGRLIDAMRAEFGDDGIEYWNAGVEGYSTPQELAYYRRFLGGLDADHVVLTFHMNDFETTPLTFVDGDGRVRIYYARRPLAQLSPWLLRYSYLYRFLIGATLENTGSDGFEEEVGVEVNEALAELAQLVQARGADLTVLVLPHLTNIALHGIAWSEDMWRRHETILASLAELDVEHHDLLRALEAAHAASIETEQFIDVQETPGDTDHPSAAFGSFVAKHLREQGFQP